MTTRLNTEIEASLLANLETGHVEAMLILRDFYLEWANTCELARLITDPDMRVVAYENGCYVFELLPLREQLRVSAGQRDPACEFILLPPNGKPTMTTLGSPEDEEGRYDDERQITLEIRPFFIARTPLIDPETRLPRTNISWDEGVEEAKKLGCHLPWEAQWEYACRAGTTTPWYTGNQPPPGNDRLVPVDQAHANPWGLLGMSRYVWQWCRDVWNNEGVQPIPFGEPAHSPESFEASELHTEDWHYAASYSEHASREEAQATPSLYGCAAACETTCELASQAPEPEEVQGSPFGPSEGPAPKDGSRIVNAVTPTEATDTFISGSPEAAQGSPFESEAHEDGGVGSLAIVGQPGETPSMSSSSSVLGSPEEVQSSPFGSAEDHAPPRLISAADRPFGSSEGPATDWDGPRTGSATIGLGPDPSAVGMDSASRGEDQGSPFGPAEEQTPHTLIAAFDRPTAFARPTAMSTVATPTEHHSGSTPSVSREEVQSSPFGPAEVQAHSTLGSAADRPVEHTSHPGGVASASREEAQGNPFGFTGPSEGPSTDGSRRNVPPSAMNTGAPTGPSSAASASREEAQGSPFGSSEDSLLDDAAPGSVVHGTSATSTSTTGTGEAGKSTRLAGMDSASFEEAQSSPFDPSEGGTRPGETAGPGTSSPPSASPEEAQGSPFGSPEEPSTTGFSRYGPPSATIGIGPDPCAAGMDSASREEAQGSPFGSGFGPHEDLNGGDRGEPLSAAQEVPDSPASASREEAQGNPFGSPEEPSTTGFSRRTSRYGRYGPPSATIGIGPAPCAAGMVSASPEEDQGSPFGASLPFGQSEGLTTVDRPGEHHPGHKPSASPEEAQGSPFGAPEKVSTSIRFELSAGSPSASERGEPLVDPLEAPASAVTSPSSASPEEAQGSPFGSPVPVEDQAQPPVEHGAPSGGGGSPASAWSEIPVIDLRYRSDGHLHVTVTVESMSGAGQISLDERFMVTRGAMHDDFLDMRNHQSSWRDAEAESNAFSGLGTRLVRLP